MLLCTVYCTVLYHQEADIVDGETLEDVGEAGLEVDRLAAEDRDAGQVPWVQGGGRAREGGAHIQWFLWYLCMPVEAFQTYEDISNGAVVHSMFIIALKLPSSLVSSAKPL